MPAAYAEPLRSSRRFSWSDATLIRVETDNGLTGMGAALGTPPIVATIVEHELAAECVGEDWEEFAPDSPLEGNGFEPLVPRGKKKSVER